MEEKENRRISLIVDDEASADQLDDNSSVWQRLKKPLIFGLMAIIFIACLYLIFKPRESEQKKDSRIKDAVPEATEKGLQADKQKAYEKELLEEKEAAKRNGLMSLSDYWNGGDSMISDASPNASVVNPLQANSSTSSLASYQHAQQTIGAFYKDDDREKLELRRKVDQLQERLSEKDVPATPTLNDQLALMEKSYEMASRYLPTGTVPSAGIPSEKSLDSSVSGDQGKSAPKEMPFQLNNMHKGMVTSLSREQGLSDALAGDLRNRFFITAGVALEERAVKNSLRAMVMETQIISGEGSVKLRLQEPAMIGGHSIPKGNSMVAAAKFQGNRLQLKISSVEVNGTILPVEIIVYDLDGQPGLSVPRSDELNAAGEIAANMSQSSGMNISMSRSAGQQIVGDLSRGLVQGVSGYFSKKLRTAKVTIKAGHQVLLFTKK